MRKLKYREIKEVRDKLYNEQSNICLLCNQIIESGQEVLDHRHSDGIIRGVIHKFCNTYLGKIENNIKRNKLTDIQVKNILNNAHAYMNINSELIHPTFKTKKK